MKPLLVLLGTFGIFLIVQKSTGKKLDYQLAGRIAMSAMLLFTAIGHFAFPEGMSAMVPDFLPSKKNIVYATGVLEIGFALALFFPDYRKLTGWLLIAFFILILPANIKAAMENIDYQTGQENGPGLAYLWFRIPLQILFVVWVYCSVLKSPANKKDH